MSLFLIKKSTPKPINSFLSIVLDSLRIIAALVVVIFHAYEQWFPQNTAADSISAKAAHTAVIIFFVLSGYVIAFTTSTNNRGGTQYAQARLSRLCSIVIPALLITALCDGLVLVIDPKLHLLFSRPPVYFRYLISGFFSNEIWFFSSAPPINGPLWSLSYEFWFYTIFGLWLYSGKGWRCFFITLAGCLVAGPKILLLMPIWLFGCFAYLYPQRRIPITLSTLSFVILFLFVIVLTVVLPIYPYLIGAKPFYFANQFVTDWILGLFIATAIWLLSDLKIENKNLISSGKVRFLADLTFPIYVLHNPLFVLWRAIFGTQYSNGKQMAMAAFVVLIISGFTGFLLEKQRYLWILFFKRLLNKAKNIFYKQQDVSKLSNHI